MPLSAVQQFASELKTFAKNELKIDLIGIASADPLQSERVDLESFLQNKFQGKMSYLENSELRIDPKKLLPSAQSVIVIGINYYRPQKNLQLGEGRIARYAWGRDYHKVIRKLLKKLAAFVVQTFPEAETKLCVDSAPLMEKSFATRAGLGFIGKNTLLINQNFGSWLLLGELITSLPLPTDQPLQPAGTCGTCTRCIDICPTGAILKPGKKINATRCISYLTIEDKDSFPEFITADPKQLSGYLFGCDLCQEVCPYNKSFQKPLQLKEFTEVKIAGEALSLEEILAIPNDEKYLEKFAGSPLMRAKRRGLQKNAVILAKARTPREFGAPLITPSPSEPSPKTLLA